MIINVTQEHIDKGQRQVWDSCPIALAAKDLGIKDVAVYDKTITIFDTKFQLPLEAQTFLLAFDHKMDVEPFDFEIELSTLLKVQLWLSK